MLRRRHKATCLGTPPGLGKARRLYELMGALFGHAEKLRDVHEAHRGFGLACQAYALLQVPVNLRTG
jgi:hypothetical protein